MDKKERNEEDYNAGLNKPEDRSSDTFSLIDKSGMKKDAAGHRSYKPPERQIIKCPNCEEVNDFNRKFCWVCYNPLHESLSGEDSGVVVRKSYLFVPEETDKSPEEEKRKKDQREVEIDYEGPVGNHSDRIPTRTGEEVIKIPSRDIQIFKGTHLIAVRIDGKNYTSEDVNVPIEARMIIRRVQEGEAPQKILDEIRDASAPEKKSRKSPRYNPSGKKRFFQTFTENFATIIIVGLVIVFLFLLLNIVVNY